MSAECEKHGVDLHGDTFSGLICPVCEAESERDTALERVSELLEAVERYKREANTGDWGAWGRFDAAVKRIRAALDTEGE